MSQLFTSGGQSIGVSPFLERSESVSHSVMSDSLPPMDYSPPTPLSLGFPRQECWSGLLFPSPGDLPDPGIEPGSPALQADSLPSDSPGKPIP